MGGPFGVEVARYLRPCLGFCGRLFVRCSRCFLSASFFRRFFLGSWFRLGIVSLFLKLL
jgi:hypothetical protein